MPVNLRQSLLQCHRLYLLQHLLVRVLLSLHLYLPLSHRVYRQAQVFHLLKVPVYRLHLLLVRLPLKVHLSVGRKVHLCLHRQVFHLQLAQVYLQVPQLVQVLAPLKVHPFHLLPRNHLQFLLLSHPVNHRLNLRHYRHRLLLVRQSHLQYRLHCLQVQVLVLLLVLLLVPL